MKRILAIFSFIFLFLLFPGLALAQESPDTEISLKTPMIYEEVAPGEIRLSFVELSNNGQNAVQLEPVLITIDSVNEYGQVQLDDSLPEVSDWITFDSGKFKIEPGQSRKFSFSIDVPTDATPGGYSMTVSFNTIVETLELESHVTNSVGIGAILLINVVDGAGVEASGKILSLEHTGSLFEEHSIEMLYENTGQSIILPVGTIEIQNMFGKVVDMNVLDDHWLLPGFIFRYQNTWNPRSTFGKYTATTEVVNIAGMNNSESISFWSFGGGGLVVFVALVTVVMVLSFLAFKILFKVLRIIMYRIF